MKNKLILVSIGFTCFSAQALTAVCTKTTDGNSVPKDVSITLEEPNRTKAIATYSEPGYPPYFLPCTINAETKVFECALNDWNPRHLPISKFTINFNGNMMYETHWYYIGDFRVDTYYECYNANSA